MKSLKSIFENVAYGLRIQGINDKQILEETVENSLRGAALWDEMKDRLNDNALGMSGGQQQRVFLARAMFRNPDILIMDEPTSGVDVRTRHEVLHLLADLHEDGLIFGQDP